MPSTQAGSDTFDATVDLILDGEDYTYTTFQQGEILKLLNRTTYLKNRVFEGTASTVTGAKVFTNHVTLSGRDGRLIKRYHLQAIGSATIDFSYDVYELPHNASGASYILVLDKNSSVPVQGDTVTIFQNDGSNNVHSWEINDNAGATLASFPTSTGESSVTFVYTGSAWQTLTWAGSVVL